MNKVTGLLERWYVEELDDYDNEVLIWGHIYNDIKDRFPNGLFMHTSGVSVKQKPFKEGDVIVTRNSTYKLGKPR